MNKSKDSKAEKANINLKRKCSFCGSNLAETGVEHPDGILCTNCQTIN